jgi:hypothetical protein
MTMPLRSLAHRAQDGPHGDLEALLVRMAQRNYPESMPVLASYWLKTVYAAGHKRSWWKELNGLFKRTLEQPEWTGTAREALQDIQTWIEQAVIHGDRIPTPAARQDETTRRNRMREGAAAYACRLLNQSLSAEISWILVNESDSAAFSQESGIPVLATAKALERLLVRERFSQEALEALLQCELSPRDAYPGDIEIMRDVVLALLGRVWAPVASAMPAIVLAAESPLPANYPDLVRQAVLLAGQGTPELHVPLGSEQALAILQGEKVRVGSILVTMDGRWWEAETLESGDQYSVVYKPGGVLRIDNTADHARLHVPWPDTQLRWSGGVHFGVPFEIFGREWNARSWETDGERTWLHLMFSRTLPIVESLPSAEQAERHSRPAMVDMAWAALENAIAAGISQRSMEPIDQLRRSEMIPLGRAIYGLAESVMNPWLPKGERIRTQLRAIRYLEAEGSLQYGRVPWRILPPLVQKEFLRKRSDSTLRDLLRAVFDDLPGSLSGTSQAA